MYRLGIATIILATAFAGAAVAQDFDNRIYLSPRFGYVFSDGDRNTEDSVMYGVGLGKYFTPRLAVDLEFDKYNLELDDGTDREIENWSLGVMARYSVWPTLGRFRPYLGIGGGLINHENPFGNQFDENSGGPMVNAVGGIEWRAFSGAWFRGEVGYRLDLDDEQTPSGDDFDDIFVSLNLVVPLSDLPEPAPEPIVEPVACPDADDDGVCDQDDRCPGTPIGVAVDRFGCPLDSDGDGVPDFRDDCPNTPPGTLVDDRGCPLVSLELEDVNFEFDSARLTPESRGILNRHVEALEQYPNVDLEVAGHTDSIGSEQYNLGLSDRRAASVYNYLVENGISASRLTSRGYGESRPIATNDTAAGRALNRRTELVVLD